jgi:hypothetical protein
MYIGEEDKVCGCPTHLESRAVRALLLCKIGKPRWAQWLREKIDRGMLIEQAPASWNGLLG